MVDSGKCDGSHPEHRPTETGGRTPTDNVDASIGELLNRCVTATGVDGAVVAIVPDDVRTRDQLYATDAVAARIDELQFTLGEGPCLQAFVHGQAQLATDIADHNESKGWPIFASEVLDELDVHGVFAFPLFVGGAKLGVLELYRREAAPFTAVHLAAAHAAAAALATAVAAELVSRSTQLVSAPNQQHGPTRSLRADVHIAVGMLAVRLALPLPDAFDRLRARAYADSRSISSFAFEIVHGTATIDDAESV